MRCAGLDQDLLDQDLNVARALIIGYGNPLRSDDGFGSYAAHELSTRFHGSDVEIISRQQLTPELAEHASHFQLVIFIDAARDCPPGKLRCEEIKHSENSGQAEFTGFSHFLTPAALLAWTAGLYNRFPQAYYVRIGGQCFDEGETISPTVLAALPPLIEKIGRLTRTTPETLGLF